MLDALVLADSVWSRLGDSLLSPWGACQLAALTLAGLCFWVRTASPALRPLRRTSWLAVAGAMAGSLLLGSLLALPGHLIAGSPISFAGITAYGALAGTCVAFAVLSPPIGLRRGDVLDVLAPCLGLLVGVARVGCFLAGCDFGAPTTVPWAVTYPKDTPAFGWHRDAGWIAPSAAHSLPVHPTQLYEAALGLTMFAVAIALERTWRGASRGDERRAPRAGALFATVAAIYGIGRAAIDAFRGDALVHPTTAQWLGLVVVAVVALWLTDVRAGGTRPSPTCSRPAAPPDAPRACLRPARPR